MEYNKLDWPSDAIKSCFEKIDFIFLKWNPAEVQNFVLVADKEIKNVSNNLKIGLSASAICKMVISKQTILCRKIDQDKSQIDLFYFWNNSNNSDDLKKY